MRQRIESELSALHGLQREVDLRHKIIGVQLFTARNKRGLGLRTIATAADINHSHLSRIERGETRASLDVLESVMGALERTPASTRLECAGCHNSQIVPEGDTYAWCTTCDETTCHHPETTNAP